MKKKRKKKRFPFSFILLIMLLLWLFLLPPELMSLFLFFKKKIEIIEIIKHEYEIADNVWRVK